MERDRLHMCSPHFHQRRNRLIAGRSIGWAEIRNEFPFKEYFFTPAFEPDHVPIITIKLVPLDNDSLFRHGITEWKFLAYCMANGELWSLPGHPITQKFSQIERT
jgi:hypothetical protein